MAAMTKYAVLAHNHHDDTADWRIADGLGWARYYAAQFAETFDMVYIRECAASVLEEVDAK